LLGGTPKSRLGGKLKLQPGRRRLLRLGRCRRGLPHLGEEADPRSALGETHHVAILEVGLLDPFAVHKGPVHALVHHPKTVSFPDDCCMLARHDGEINRETKVTGRLPPDDNLEVGKLLDLSLQGPLNVNKLNDDCWWTLHG
jgi:hypothetical protein